MVDSTLGSNYSTNEVERCVHVGLLCTQEDPTKRPDMASVLIMLNAQLKIELPSPTSPPNCAYKQENSSVSQGSCAIPIEDVVTEILPR